LRQFPSKKGNSIKRKPAFRIINPLLKSANYKLALAVTGFEAYFDEQGKTITQCFEIHCKETQDSGFIGDFCQKDYVKN